MDKIIIGPQTFEIKIIDDLHDGANSLDGHIVFGKSEIRLDSDLDKFGKLQTTWHEIIHGILSQAGLHEIYSKQHEITEQVVEAISYGVLRVLQDNPKLRDCIYTWDE